MVQSMVARDRKTLQRPVKIAILDTGVDATHSQMSLAMLENRIVAHRGFPPTLEPLQDRHGHGTYAASILMRTADHAVLHIARIADDHAVISHVTELVKVLSALRSIIMFFPQAIDWCIEQRVDIVSISWGYSEDVPEIANALNNAIKDGILIFASTGDRGANSPITFPARLKNVFCIGSADGKGVSSSTNPPSEGREMFSILGECIVAAYPGHCNKKYVHGEPNSSVIDGSGTAVVIAVGIAALFLDFTIQHMEMKRVGRFENMRKLFLEISKSTAGKEYRYLVPWRLFNQREDPKVLFQSSLCGDPGTNLSPILVLTFRCG